MYLRWDQLIISFPFCGVSVYSDAVSCLWIGFCWRNDVSETCHFPSSVHISEWSNGSSTVHGWENLQVHCFIWQTMTAGRSIAGLFIVRCSSVQFIVDNKLVRILCLMQFSLICCQQEAIHAGRILSWIFNCTELMRIRTWVSTGCGWIWVRGVAMSCRCIPEKEHEHVRVKATWHGKPNGETRDKRPTVWLHRCLSFSLLSFRLWAEFEKREDQVQTALSSPQFVCLPTQLPDFQVIGIWFRSVN